MAAASSEQQSAEPWTIAGKVVIVTGCNTGIGRVTVLELAKRGAAKVIMACRNIQAAEETAKDIREKAGFSETEGATRVVVKHLDLASFESVRKFAADINATEPALHVLVNNAGLESPNERLVTVDGNELTFQTNHLGHFLLTNLLLDLLKRSKPARVVVVASTAYQGTYLSGGFDVTGVNQERRSYAGFRAYGQSKLANILFARTLHQRLNGGPDEAVTGAPKSGVSVFMLHPGVVRTDFLRSRRGFSFMDIIFIGAITPEEGAKTTLHCCCEPGIEPLSGKYFEKSKEKSLWAIAKDDAKANALWELSEKLVNKPKTDNTSKDEST